MKQFYFLILSLCFGAGSYAQKAYWQQRVNYVIEVTLNDKEKTLDAFEKITYTNHSPDTLTYIWFHLWPNAYKNDRTALSDQLLENGDTRFYFSTKEERGYINRLDFKVNGATAKTEDHPQYIDVVKLILPQPLSPSQQITITTPFHVKLPFNFSRGGYDQNTFQITQWYPKPAVYDRDGWHPMPYLDQGEFCSEFGSYDVRITLPQEYVVAATGELQNEEEKEWFKQSRYLSPNSDIPINQIPKKHKPVKVKTKAKSIILPPNTIATAATKTLRYKQDNVHDFALFANKNFIVNYDTCKIAADKTVDIYTFFTPDQKEIWKNSMQYCKDALRFYSNEVGIYPYNVLSAVQGPPSFGGGMEYPTITVISPTDTRKNLDMTLTHEIGHNWFYGILASNERLHPWMDEGINTFYEYQYDNRKYEERNQLQELLFQTKAIRKTDQPIETPAASFSALNYQLIPYHKTAKWMRLLENKVGHAHFKKTMQQYYQQWKFRHPQPQDLEALFKQHTTVAIDSVFALLHTKGLLPNEPLHGWKFATPFTPNSLKQYINYPSKNLLLVSPVLGANVYDKLQLGAMVTNYKLPPNKLQFLAVPLYSTGAKQLTGLGKINYTLYPNKWFRQANIFVNAATFSMDEYTGFDGHTTRLQFQKIVPGIRLIWNEKNPRSQVQQYIQWKTYFISEDGLRFFNDTSTYNTDTVITINHIVTQQHRYLNQLQWTYENFRALYPFNITVRIEQAKDFFKPTVATNYFFNYSPEGGLNVRFFAGKFFYLKGKTIYKQFETERYQLNMSGPNGYEDYTYQDYFIGRNEYDGISSQQIMLRDGGFKVRTELLSSKVGKSDDWLMAANFTSDIPVRINPLSLLPMRIPLRLFADVGTYAGAWQHHEGNRFLFDAGLQIPLFNDLINVYIPIAYSKVYRDYYKSTIAKNRFLKTISFSINLNSKTIRSINKELEF